MRTTKPHRFVIALVVVVLALPVHAQDGNPTVPIPTSTATSTPQPTATPTGTPRAYITATPNGVATLDTISIPLPRFNAPSTVTPVNYSNSNSPAVGTALANVTAIVGQTNNVLATITAIAVTPLANLDGSTFDIESERTAFRESAVDLFSILKSIDWDIFGKLSILLYATVTAMLIVVTFNTALTIASVLRRAVGVVWNVALKLFVFIRSLIPFA